MPILIVLLILPPIFGCMNEPDQEAGNEFLEAAAEENPRTRFTKLEEMLNKSSQDRRFSMLPITAKSAFNSGDIRKAYLYANELLELAKKYKSGPDYGNAIHDGNLVLGRIAIKEGNIELAKECLIKAGSTPGSTVLAIYGPNMTLAKDLLAHNEKETVIKYFRLCKRFWKHEDGRIDSWIASIKGGGMPYFGNNLLY
ncbi:MAG: hypothetical protein GY705_06060 [Bacteroidetes bacterium]|nr:hypothetical protein [Bacteroidota bacterium]